MPSLDPKVTLSAAVQIALDEERDDLEDIIFDQDEDAQLVIYVQVSVVLLCSDLVFRCSYGPDVRKVERISPKRCF